MAKQYLYRYSVVGTPSFPYDMLRYDAAWPASESEAAKLYTPAPQPGRKAMAQTITLHSHKAPTLARWRSFGWVVSQPMPPRTAL